MTSTMLLLVVVYEGAYVAGPIGASASEMAIHLCDCRCIVALLRQWTLSYLRPMFM